MNSDISNHLSKDKIIRFGTDGWRAVIGDMYTFENLKIIGQAIADYLHEQVGDSARVAVGYDTRFMSEEFAGVIAETLAANKISVLLSREMIPTPVLSYSVKHLHLNAGIMLTASHNPYFYHGLKFKGPFGGPAGTEMTQRIEYFLRKQKDVISAKPTKAYIEMIDFFPAYHQHIMTLLDMKKLGNYKSTIYYDPMYGAGQGFLQKLLVDTPVRIESLHMERNPIFGGLNPEPIPKNLQELKKYMVDQPGNIGIATDGDADRFGILDHHGIFVAMHELLALLFKYIWDVRGWRGQVVRSNSMADSVDILAKKRGAPVQEVPVGFKHITEEMIYRETLIGAEESGGFGYGVHIPERDGLLSALLLMEMLEHYDSDISELLADLRGDIGQRSYDRIDFYRPTDLLQKRMEFLKREVPVQIGDHKINSTDDRDGLKFYFENDSWMLIRLSATEPMGRIYATATNQAEVQELLISGKKIMTEEV